MIDRFLVSEAFLARLKLVRGDVDGAAAMLVQAEQAARQKNFILRLPDIAANQVLVLLHQGNLTAAAQLAGQYDLPHSQARVLIAQHDPAAAWALLEPLRRQAVARGWVDQQLKTLVLQALAQYVNGEKAQATQLLDEALALAEPGGFIRLFVDEGEPMAELLTRMKDEGGRMKEYVHKLLAAFGEGAPVHPSSFIPHSLVEPLTSREQEVLRLIAQGLSNHEIGARLFLALDTVKGHNRRIFEKLQVQRRTEAIARARELGLL